MGSRSVRVDRSGFGLAGWRAKSAAVFTAGRGRDRSRPRRCGPGATRHCGVPDTGARSPDCQYGGLGAKPWTSQLRRGIARDRKATFRNGQPRAGRLMSRCAPAASATDGARLAGLGRGVGLVVDEDGRVRQARSARRRCASGLVFADPRGHWVRRRERYRRLRCSRHS
jgi:hypothetical protein